MIRTFKTLVALISLGLCANAIAVTDAEVDLREERRQEREVARLAREWAQAKELVLENLCGAGADCEEHAPRVIALKKLTLRDYILNTWEVIWEYVHSGATHLAKAKVWYPHEGKEHVIVLVIRLHPHEKGQLVANLGPHGIYLW